MEVSNVFVRVFYYYHVETIDPAFKFVSVLILILQPTPNYMKRTLNSQMRILCFL